MKNKKIVFSGVMAVILSAGAANAAVDKIASQAYVDSQNTAQTTAINASVDTKLQDYAQKSELTGLATEEYVDTAVEGVVSGELSGYVTTETYNAGMADKASTTSVGDVTTLTTVNKTSTVAAINELDTAVSANTNDITALDGRVTTANTTATEAKTATETLTTSLTTTQGQLDALAGRVDNETTGLAATKKIADDAATLAAEAKAGLDDKVGTADLANYVTIEAAKAYETTAHASATYADKTTVETLDNMVNSETAGLAKTKEIADAAKAAAEANAAALTNKLEAADLADYETKANASATYATKTEFNTLNSAVTNAESGLAATKSIADAAKATADANAGKFANYALTSSLGDLATVKIPEACQDPTNSCVLTTNGTTFAWEPIAR